MMTHPDTAELNKIIMDDVINHHLIADTRIQEQVEERIKLLKDRLSFTEFGQFM